MHRVFCENIPPAGATAEIDNREKEHLFKVFRAAPGDEVELLDGAGRIARGTVEAGKVIRIDSVREYDEPEMKLHLCCALPRKQKLDQMLKQVTELGVWSIRPLKCIRSVAEGGPRERWDLLLREACKQSGNPFMPRILPEEKLPAALQRLQAENISIYYGDVVPDGGIPDGMNNRRALLIGPEGGFAPQEIELMLSGGAKPFNFAPYILRLETAAVCGLTALRMLGAVMVMASALFFTGCKEGAIEKNPLLIKGAKLRESGDVQSARRYFRQAVAVYPERPESYLALAQLCDEELDDPLEALYCYRMYLQYTTPDAAERKAVENIVAMLEKRAVEKFAGKYGLNAEKEKMQRQIADLTRLNNKMKDVMIRQQLRLIKLESGKNAAGKGKTEQKSGRKK